MEALVRVAVTRRGVCYRAGDGTYVKTTARLIPRSAWGSAIRGAYAERARDLLCLAGDDGVAHGLVRVVACTVSTCLFAEMLTTRMEYAGTPLDAWTLQRAGGTVDEQDACALLAGMLSAVAYLLARGVVHCDISPSNVCVQPGPAARPRAVLIDLESLRRIGSATHRSHRASAEFRVDHPDAPATARTSPLAVFAVAMWALLPPRPDGTRGLRPLCDSAPLRSADDRYFDMYRGFHGPRPRAVVQRLLARCGVAPAAASAISLLGTVQESAADHIAACQRALQAAMMSDSPASDAAVGDMSARLRRLRQVLVSMSVAVTDIKTHNGTEVRLWVTTNGGELFHRSVIDAAVIGVIEESMRSLAYYATSVAPHGNEGLILTLAHLSAPPSGWPVSGDVHSDGFVRLATPDDIASARRLLAVAGLTLAENACAVPAAAKPPELRARFGEVLPDVLWFVAHASELAPPGDGCERTFVTEDPDGRLVLKVTLPAGHTISGSVIERLRRVNSFFDVQFTISTADKRLVVRLIGRPVSLSVRRGARAGTIRRIIAQQAHATLQ